MDLRNERQCGALDRATRYGLGACIVLAFGEGRLVLGRHRLKHVCIILDDSTHLLDIVFVRRTH